MTTFDVYLFTRLDGLVVTAWLIFVLLCIVAIVMFIGWVGDDLREETIQKYVPKLIISLIVSLLISIAIPTTKDAAIIYVLPKIVNNEDVQKLPSEIVQLARKKLAELMETGKEGK